MRMAIDVVGAENAHSSAIMFAATQVLADLMKPSFLEACPRFCNEM